jgi:hypothetical protein
MAVALQHEDQKTGSPAQKKTGGSMAAGSIAMVVMQSVSGRR